MAVTAYTTQLSINSLTVVKAAAGWLLNLTVTVSGSTVGTAFDASYVSGTVAEGQSFYTIPQAVGVYSFQYPGWAFSQGLTVAPGSGQVVNVEFR